MRRKFLEPRVENNRKYQGYQRMGPRRDDTLASSRRCLMIGGPIIQPSLRMRKRHGIPIQQTSGLGICLNYTRAILIET